VGDSSWVDVVGVDELPHDDVIGVEVAGRELAIYRIGEDVYASDNICTHAHARLCDGFLDGYSIECPLHQGKFDVREGRPLCDPVSVPLRTYPTKIENARVLVLFE
jgi:naphthalene 1,2-dioxygenase ferredoxin component